MKITMKLMGVLLTLALLIGLIASAVPVSAGNLTWTDVKSPKVVETDNANIFTVAADGKTIYLYDNGDVDDDDVEPFLWKSTNAGVSFSKTGINVPDSAGNLTMIKVSQSSATNLIATDGATVWKSTNGGVKWTNANTAITAGVTSIDISANADGDVVYLVVAGGEVYLYDGGWMDTSAELASGYQGTALAAAFSPNYDSDNTIVSVSTTYVQGLVLDVEEGDNVWDTQIADVPWDPAITSAKIALPSDFFETEDSTVAFVASNTGLFAVHFNSELGAVPLNTQATISSLSYTGTNDEGTLAWGYSGKVYTSTAAGTATVALKTTEYKKSAKSPIGNAMNVILSPADDTIFAGTSGDFSGLFTSTDNVAYDGIAFMNVQRFAWTVLGSNTGMGGATQYQWVTDNNGTPGPGDAAEDDYNMLFVTADSGTSWKMIFSSEAISYMVNLSPSIATDKTIYLTVSGNKEIKKSTDNGETWKTVYAPATFTTFAAIDGTSYWLGNANGIKKSTAGSSYVYLDGNIPFVMITIPGFYVVKAASSEPNFLADKLNIYVSTDDGATFQRLGGQTDTVSGIGFDVPSKTVYGVSTDSGNLVKWVVGTSDAWVKVLNAEDLPANVTSINPAANGIFYFTVNTKDMDVTDEGDEEYFAQIYRATGLRPGAFEAVPGTTAPAIKGYIASIPPMGMGSNADGAAILYVKLSQGAYTPQPNKYAYKWVSFTDTMMNAPKITAPAADAAVPYVVDFSWQKVTDAKKYEVQVAYDVDFGNIAEELMVEDATSSTVWNNVDLTPGKTYYWRVRVATGAPIASAWSAPAKFVTQLDVNVDEGLNTASMSPAKGATGIALNSAFTWGIVNGATGYDFQLSDKADFSTTLDSQTGLTTSAYSTTAALKNSTTYFWRVRAVNANGASAWVTSAFTTAAPATVAPTQAVVTPTIILPTPTVIVPTQPVAPVNNSTPAWAWVVIVIGAVLVIAVIILIVRTRRV